MFNSTGACDHYEECVRKFDKTLHLVSSEVVCIPDHVGDVVDHFRIR